MELPVLDRMLRILERPLLAVAGMLIFVMMLHVVADVVGRYVFLKPITGTLEIVSNYYMVGIVFLPLALVQRRNSHIKVEVFTNWFSARTIAAIDAAATAVTLTYVGLMAWLVTYEAIEHTAIREKIVIGVSLVPVWPARWFVPVGTIVFLLSLVLSFFLHIRMARNNFPQDRKTDSWAEG